MRKIYTFIVCLMFIFCTFSFSHELDEIRFINSAEFKLPYRYASQLFTFSLEQGVSVYHLQKWVLNESTGNERAFNTVTRDYGLCQLHDVMYLKNKYWDKETTFNVWNGEHNLEIALAYLKDLIQEFGIHHGFMAYNIGPTRIRKGKILEIGKIYVGKIFNQDQQQQRQDLQDTIHLDTRYPFTPLHFEETLILFIRREDFWRILQY